MTETVKVYDDSGLGFESRCYKYLDVEIISLFKEEANFNTENYSDFKYMFNVSMDEHDFFLYAKSDLERCYWIHTFVYIIKTNRERHKQLKIMNKIKNLGADQSLSSDSNSSGDLDSDDSEAKKFTVSIDINVVEERPQPLVIDMVEPFKIQMISRERTTQVEMETQISEDIKLDIVEIIPENQEEELIVEDVNEEKPEVNDIL